MDTIGCGIYRLDGSEFNFQCQKCRYKKQVNGKIFQKLKSYRKVKIKCKCGAVQQFILERRKNDRMAVKLPGICYHINHSGPQDFKDIDIRDISIRGMCFQISEPSNSEPAVGNEVIIIFNQNSNANSFVTIEASIRNFHDNFYHVEFKKNGKARDDLRLKILLYSQF